MLKIACRRIALVASLPANRPMQVGGQAIIEGVMMRSKQFVAMAVRRRNGEIASNREPYVSLTQRHRILGWLFVRGFIQIYESLAWGLKSLNYSADIAAEDDKLAKGQTLQKSWSEKALGTLTLVFSFAMALGVFMYLPLWISNLIGKEQNPLLFNLMAGCIRTAFFLAYLWGISLWKDIQRIFEYHGAEHKSIFLYEGGMDLTFENAKKFKTHHPRCGTSFLLIVAAVCILIFAAIDGAVAALWGPYPSLLHRFAVHLLMIPLVSGISYEALKLSDRTRKNALVGLLVKPGLWLQHITTREPDEGQMEVAFRAIRLVI
jgi:uncharacterized protein YqhQ